MLTIGINIHLTNVTGIIQLVIFTMMTDDNIIYHHGRKIYHQNFKSQRKNFKTIYNNHNALFRLLKIFFLFLESYHITTVLYVILLS